MSNEYRDPKKVPTATLAAENISTGSGMEDMPAGLFSSVACKCPQHYQPSMIVIPQGKRYRHVSPECGTIQYAYAGGHSL